MKCKYKLGPSIRVRAYIYILLSISIYKDIFDLGIKQVLQKAQVCPLGYP